MDEILNDVLSQLREEMTDEQQESLEYMVPVVSHPPRLLQQEA